MATKPFQLGSISTGTLRTEDLLPVFAETVSLLDKNGKYESLITEANEVTNWDADENGYILEELQNALDEYCPPFVYFGAHPGDGSDLGFFPDYDALEEAKNDGCVHGDYCFLPDGEVLQISDHGNILLMDSTFNELWSIV